jgi:EPS-associated MarR family transcriptional regulator
VIEHNQKPKTKLDNEEVLSILKELSLDSRLTQRHLAQKIGISLGKTNYLIKELAKKGLVKIRNFSKKNHKFNRISYILTHKGLKEKLELTLYFLERKQKEYDNLRREWENLEKLFPRRNVLKSEVNKNV